MIECTMTYSKALYIALFHSMDHVSVVTSLQRIMSQCYLCWTGTRRLCYYPCNPVSPGPYPLRNTTPPPKSFMV